MTIRIYPSRLPGEPLETHEHGFITLYGWMVKNVPGYSADRTQPVTVEIDGRPVAPSEWPLCQLRPDSDVRFFPVPYGTGLEIAYWVAVAVSVASTAYALFFGPKAGLGGFSSASGNQLDLNPAKANTAKLGDPIREVFGCCRVYPDYLVQPVTRFDPDDPTRMTTEMFLCLGQGRYAWTTGDMRVGETPVSALGDGFSHTAYPPGTDVSADRRSENWFNSTEVGGTSTGTGLDMAQTAPESDDITADAMSVSGASVSFIGLDTENESDDTAAEDTLPDSWVAGAVVNLVAPTNYVISLAAGYNTLASNLLEEIRPQPGMAVTLNFSSVDYDLVVASYTPAQSAVPGSGGSAASLRGNAAPSTYNFSVSSETFNLTWHGVTYSISLVADYLNMSGLLSAIAEGLTGSGLVAQDDGGAVRITEESSPWQGGSITSSALPVSVFGSAPVSTAGTASTGGRPAVTASITLAYDTATGAPFSGLPEGTQRLSVAHRGNEYRISAVDGITATVERLTDGTPDATWPGFLPRTMIDFSASGINDNETWMGPFLACPRNEAVSALEVNFSFPNGICGFSSKGKKKIRKVEWEIQYRVYGSGTGWTSVTGTYALKNVNGLGFTERITLPSPGLVEVRCRRRNEQGINNARDSMFWQALRGRLPARPVSYNGITTLGVTVETGGQLAAQSDRRVNLVVTRNYDGGKNRTISGAFYHVAHSLGYRDNQIDRDTIDALESTYWTPRGEFFDHEAIGDSTSAKDIFDLITEAGMGYFLLSDGLLSAGREGIKTWSGIITPQETLEEMETAFTAPSDDDYGGVDVTYINGITWAEETVQCRTADNPVPVKVEGYTIRVAMSPDRAYRIGMRRLMKYLHQRRTYSVSTELDAWCYQFGDRLVLTDDIPSGKTLSCLIDYMSYDTEAITLHLTETPDWTYSNPRCWIRFQDGRASRLLVPQRVDDFTLTVPMSDDLHPGDWIMNDPDIELPRLLFCESERGARHALVAENAPSGDGTCQVTAPEYKDIFYSFDDAIYPGDAV